MALGIVLPALAVGTFAILLYALIADFAPALGLMILFGAGLAVCVGMSAVVAARRPMRPVEGEGTRSRRLERHTTSRRRRKNGARA